MSRDLLYTVVLDGAIILGTTDHLSGTVGGRVLLISRIVGVSDWLALGRRGSVAIWLSLNLGHRTSRLYLGRPILILLPCPIIHSFVDLRCHSFLEDGVCRLRTRHRLTPCFAHLIQLFSNIAVNRSESIHVCMK